MAVFKCKMCGGALEVQPEQTTAVCGYCGTQQTLPRLDSDQRASLYDRASHYRRNNEYDKAAALYEQLLNEDAADAEAYWSLVLCRYGVEYVEDPATHARIPTINRTQFTSVFDDENYRSALAHAGVGQRAIYEREAEAINRIQKGILEISEREAPFDVFLCYKETDANGRRTPDSVLAGDLYRELTQEGFRVFFARVTLEDKLGTAYEPYIFSALQSARVMVVLGTRPDHFNAVWVKNEWSRYLALIRGGAKKTLIPAYRDMDPYDLPEEFSHLQALDMGRLGFMQDLVHGIRKLTGAPQPMAGSAPQPAAPQAAPQAAPVPAAAPLLRRAFLFLEDGDWTSADEYCERVLDLEPENAEAYLGKLMAELRCSRREALRACQAPFDGSDNYQKALRFGGAALKEELSDAAKTVREREAQRRLQARYEAAARRLQEPCTPEAYREAAAAFAHISGYRDADARAQDCLRRAEELEKETKYAAALARQREDAIPALQEAAGLFAALTGYRDADVRAQDCLRRAEELEQRRAAEQARRLRTQKRLRRTAIIALPVALALLVISIVVTQRIAYRQAEELLEAGRTPEAAIAFGRADGYRDARARSAALWAGVAQRDVIAAGDNFTVGLRADGTVVATDDNAFGRCDVSDWQEIVSIAAGLFHTVGLRADGTVVAAGLNNDDRCDVSGWQDLVAVAAGGSHTVGLRADGTVVATGDNFHGQCDVSNWQGIVAIAAGDNHTVGLRADGTVVATGFNKYGQCDVSDWRDLVAVAAGVYHTVGLRADGTVVAAGLNNDYQCDVSGWQEIVAVAAGHDHTVGLRADGTAITAGYNRNGQCDVSGWRDLVAVAVGDNHTVGLRADGTVVATDDDWDGHGSASGWRDLLTPAA